MFAKVIWATDGSEHADSALPCAVQAAQAGGAELHVVHVAEKLVGPRAANMDAFADEDDIKAKVARQAKPIAAENARGRHAASAARITLSGPLCAARRRQRDAEVTRAGSHGRMTCDQTGSRL